MWGWGQKQSCMYTVPSPTPHTYSHTDSSTHSLHIPMFALQVRSALSSHAPQNTKLQTSRVQAWEPHEPTHSAGFTRSVRTVWKNSAHKHGWSVYCLPGEPTGIRGGHGSERAKMFVSQSLRTLQGKAPERNQLFKIDKSKLTVWWFEWEWSPMDSCNWMNPQLVGLLEKD